MKLKEFFFVNYDFSVETILISNYYDGLASACAAAFTIMKMRSLRCMKHNYSNPISLNFSDDLSSYPPKIKLQSPSWKIFIHTFCHHGEQKKSGSKILSFIHKYHKDSLQNTINFIGLSKTYKIWEHRIEKIHFL